jgi:MerR family mercuric resistance operon transcriptional regulator
MTDVLTRGQLSKQGRVNFETIRFYERKGLLPSPPRSTSGYRKYPSTSIRRLQFIKNAKELGFSLMEIGEMLELRVVPEHRCTDAIEHIHSKVREVDDKILRLKSIRKALTRLTKRCSGDCRVDECPILDELDRKGK